MKDTELTELLIFMITSAAGLTNEPASYGPLRLVDSSRRLAAILLKDHPDSEVLRKLVRIIDDGRNKSMSDSEEFVKMLTELCETSVDLLDSEIR
jgi:hypothetical protein